MKKVRILSILVLLITGMGHSYGQFSGDNWVDVKSKKSGEIVMTYVETPGFASRNNTGQIEGICVDIMEKFVEHIGKEHKVNLKLILKSLSKPEDFKLFMNVVKGSKGGVFGLGNISITEQRKKSYRFSPPFMSNVTILLTHTSVPTLEKMELIGEVFEGMNAYAVKGTTNEQKVIEIKNKYLPNLKIQHLNSSKDALAKIVTDKNSFTNVDFTYYLAVLKQRMPIKRHPAGDMLTDEFGIIMPKNNDWEPLLSDFFNDFIGGPTYKKIVVRHLGQNALKLLDAISSN
ncbi:transporter substrate-binding domain-containing protein [Fulvivirgaceae bacterium BMA10]|uniref:Transporter substrate-binding domain-containing protein n=1 Tax=Splendidivirga corallicola TaxID=3051826 RepID=A0ABT8KTE1_9BACT|nr:transporter substrate-binding domain-containing protein [Fulvivirgaceae bacterium BMA10]